MIRALLVATLALAAGCSDEWKVVHANLPGGLLSVWGTSSTDVWTVGGDAGGGAGPEVLRFDGKAWKRLHPGTAGDLWWVHGFAGGPVYMGGSGGAIYRFEGGAFTRLPTPGDQTVFGIWGAAANDLWAVGGSGDASVRGFVWRFDGATWRAVDVPGDVDAKNILLKVWGRGASDVWIVGEAGIALHWDGTSFTDTSEAFHASENQLFTVTGAGARTYAVGGFATGLILEHDGTKWAKAGPTGLQRLNGVATFGDEAWAVGRNLTVIHREGGEWTSEAVELSPVQDLHAVWIDPDGGVWAVGGEVLTLPLTQGLMIHYGDEIPSTIVP